MRILSRLPSAFAFPFRTRRRAALAVLLLAAIGYSARYAVRVVRFDRSLAAAQAALAAYDFPAARASLAECARLRPHDSAIPLLEAQAARRDGALDEAAAHLARYQELAGSTADGRLEEMLLRVHRGRIEADVHYLMSLADSKHPATELILEALAVGSIHVYHLDKAEFWIGHLLARYPKNPIGRLIRAQTDDTLGRRDRALAGCRELLADFPGNAKARLLLAALLFKTQKFDEAIAQYRDMLLDRPGNLEALLGLARCLDRLDATGELREVMRELEERHPDNSEALLACGRFAVRENRLADAERVLRRAVQIAPSDHEVHYQLGLCLEQLGKTEEAQLHLALFKRIEADLVRMERLLAEMVKAPQDPAPRREVGLICLRNGQVEEGLRWLHGVLETAPNDRETHEALADFYLARGDFERSVQHRRQIR